MGASLFLHDVPISEIIDKHTPIHKLFRKEIKSLSKP